MIIGLLVMTIGLIPVILAFSVSRIYRETVLSHGLFTYMVLITIWQLDIAVLYFREFLSEQQALILFRLFRLAPTFAVLIVYYIAYNILKNNPTTFKEENILNKILKLVFNKKVLILVSLWSTFVYLINWTKLGIEGLTLRNFNVGFYFPEYGPLSWLYTIHMGCFLLFVIFVFLISNKISNTTMKNFLKNFSIYSFLLFISGVLNFSPATGVISSSIGVVLFSIMIVFEFIKLNTNISMINLQLVERQKKLDYTGSLAGSLIHEVKNANQIIMGFSKLLSQSSSLTEAEKGSVDMVMNASEQIEDLSENYKEYMRYSKMEFHREELDLIINESIVFSKGFLKEKDIHIEYENVYDHLQVYVNKTYFRQVFVNLIKNSSEAIPHDRKNKRIQIKIELEKEETLIHFYDNGNGIPIDNWESIFDPFISFKKNGMGLGLPFVKKIIFEHRGDIRIIESSTEGTHIQISLPLILS